MKKKQEEEIQQAAGKKPEQRKGLEAAACKLCALAPVSYTHLDVYKRQKKKKKKKNQK